MPPHSTERSASDNRGQFSDTDRLRLSGVGFLMIVLVLYIHAMRPERSPSTDAVSLAQAVIGNGFGRVAVPFYFAVSGFLFFRQVPRQQSAQLIKSKISRRVSSLLIPYLLWSAIGMLIFLGLSQLPGFGGYFSHPDNRIADMDLFALLRRWVIHPVPGQLWFVRDLLAMTVLSPIVFWVSRSAGLMRASVIAVLFGWWLKTGCEPPRSRGLASSDAALFFTFGAIVSEVGLHKLDGLRSKYVTVGLTLAWLVLIGIELALTNSGAGSIRKLTVLAGLPAVWSLALQWDVLWNSQAFRSTTEMTFFIFVAHQPMMSLMKTLAYSITGNSVASVLAYMLLPIVVLVALYGTGLMLRHYTPAMFALLTGGRGMARAA